jgi:hypothetical protein
MAHARRVGEPAAAGDLMYNRAGETVVYSKDGPNGGKLPVDVASGFSFETFGASVKVSERACPGSGSPGIVTVIVGETKVALPGLGSGNDASSMLSSKFTLREVSLTFKMEPGIPGSLRRMRLMNSAAACRPPRDSHRRIVRSSCRNTRAAADASRPLASSAITRLIRPGGVFSWDSAVYFRSDTVVPHA